MGKLLTYKMPEKEFEKEHYRLANILPLSNNATQRREEARDQYKEVLDRDNSMQVASVAPTYNFRQHILMGKRNDSGKWTLPGGHIEGTELPIDGALRELQEETGIEADPNEVKYLGSKTIISPEGKKLTIHAYEYDMKARTTTKEDPDEEVSKWHYIDIINDKLPEDIIDNLHAPKNVTLELLGLFPTKGMLLTLKAIQEDIPQRGLFEENPKSLNIGEVSKDINPEKITDDGGKYRVGNDIEKTKGLSTILHSYGTHKNFLDNPKPEHQAIVDKIKTIHPNDDTIRETFNNTIGRYKQWEEKPPHLLPSAHNDTHLSHKELTNNHWAVPDLEEEHKKALDNYGTSKNLLNALNEGKTSKDLTNYLKDWNSAHFNKGRVTRLYNPEKHTWNEGPLDRWYKNPVSGDRALINNPDLDREERPRFSRDMTGDEQFPEGVPEDVREHQEYNKFLRNKEKKEQRHQKELETLPVPKFKEGETINFAGQNHKILQDLGERVIIQGDDGIKRNMNKMDLAYIKHKPYDIFNTPEGDNIIHTDKFKKKLLGGTIDKLATEISPSAKERLQKYGFNDDEIHKIFAHLSDLKPIKYNKSAIEKKKNAMGKVDSNIEHFDTGDYNDPHQIEQINTFDGPQDLETEGELNSEDVKNLNAINYTPEKDYENRMNEYNKKKEDYQNIIMNKKDRINALEHPSKNPDYEKDITNPKIDKALAHPFIFPDEKNVEKAITKSEIIKAGNQAGAQRLENEPHNYKYATVSNILTNLKLENNALSQDKIMEIIKTLEEKHKVKTTHSDTGELLVRLNKSFTQLNNYVIGKLKMMKQKMELITGGKLDNMEQLQKDIEAHGIRQIWSDMMDHEDNLKIDINTILSKSFNIMSNSDNPQKEEEEIKSLFKNVKEQSLYYGCESYLYRREKETIGLEKLSKSVPVEPVFSNEDGIIYSIYFDPKEGGNLTRYYELTKSEQEENNNG